MLDIAYNNSDRLVRLINDILDVEKLEAGKMEFQMAPLDLGPLLRQAIDANKGYGETYDVRFILVGETQAAMVQGDHDRLMQVLANLLSNAAKFSPEGASVEISLTRVQDGFRVAVADQGPGISEDFRDKVFSRFSQADSSDTRSKGGTGLGLNITKAIVEDHGGTIGFETGTGKGTVFFFVLPGLEQDKPGEEETGHHRILICEDEPDVAEMLATVLEHDGFETDIAGTAEAAAEMLERRDYDAMTLDLVLPDKDGLTLLRELRGKPETRDLPVIVVSVKARRDVDEQSGDPIDVVDWLEKPIDEGRLLRIMRIAVTSSSEGRPRILHVEEDQDIVDVVRAVVGDLAEMVPARTLSRAECLLKHQSFDLVILDLTLPDGDGENLLHMLKRKDGTSMPVIVFSSKDVSDRSSHNVQTALIKSRTSNEALLHAIRSIIETGQEGVEPMNVVLKQENR